MSEALPLRRVGAARPAAGHRDARGAGAEGAGVVRRPDHLPVHRELHHRGGDVRPRPRPPHRLHGAVVETGRPQRRASPRGVRRRLGGRLDVDQQHGDSRHDVPDRALDRDVTSRRSRSPRTRASGASRRRSCSSRRSARRIGGMATPIGTPPNLIGVGMLRELVGAPVSFFRWMLIGLPITLALYTVLAVGFWVVGARGLRLPEGTADLVRRELERLGRVSRGERNVMIAFFTTVLLWVFPGLLAVVGLRDAPIGRAYEASMPEAAAALTGAILLFVLPVDWRSAASRCRGARPCASTGAPILLFGGGLALGSMAFSTGLAASIGPGRDELGAVAPPVAVHHPVHVLCGRALGDDVEHGVGEHGRASRHRRQPGGRHQSHRTGPGRHASAPASASCSRSRRRRTPSRTAPDTCPSAR